MFCIHGGDVRNRKQSSEVLQAVIEFMPSMEIFEFLICFAKFNFDILGGFDFNLFWVSVRLNFIHNFSKTES